MTKKITLSPKIAEFKPFMITSTEHMEEATASLSLLNKELDRIVTDKEKLTKPMNEALKEVRARYKPFEAQLEDAIRQVRAQMSLYHTQQTEDARIQAEKITNRIGEGKGKIKIETAMNQLANIDTPPATLSSQHGSVSFREVTKCEVKDITKVPYEYLEADLTAIKKQLPLKITGVRYWTEQQPINRW